MLLYMHEQGRHTWASSLCYLMYRHGFDEAWENRGVGNETAFVRLFRERLIARYKQEWCHDLHDKECFQLYRTFKSDLVLAPYLTDLKHIKSRKSRHHAQIRGL